MSSNPENLHDPVARAAYVRASMPPGGLFAQKSWRVAPRPFALGAGHVRLLEGLGQALYEFSLAANLLYRHSVEGKAPGWIAALLDAGKPPELVELARNARVKGRVPAVIRPDLVLTEEGFALAEIDSVPGGIGLTAWMGETYAALGEPVLGGATAMREAFHALLGADGEVVISREASDYRPEMEWLVGADRVKDAETYAPGERPVYRFFEAFDWEAMPNWHAPGFDPARTPVTPPLKPYLEEKLWLALFWSRPLREHWRVHLGERKVRLLEGVIPRSWVLDPTPLPPHGVIPGLEIASWEELKVFSQKERDLILKISGFSPLAWGARGVVLGSDLSAGDWAAAVQEALDRFPTHPHVLMRFAHGALVEQDYVDDPGDPGDGGVSSAQVRRLRGRARVSPYYFVGEGEKARLCGVLVTLCPADKKLLHGMPEAVLSPAAAA